VDWLRVNGRPEFVDFSVTGIGLTPYSEGGFVNVGRDIDGKLALSRAVHRMRYGDRLESAGCRVPKVLALIELHGDYVRSRDGQYLTAALITRGFRSVMRVKQLDPVACFYQSHRHRRQMAAFLVDSIQRTPLAPGSGKFTELTRRQRLTALLDRFLTLEALQMIRTRADGVTVPPELVRQVIAQRFWLIKLYVPLVLDLIKPRVLVELGRDPDAERLSDQEYALWFAGRLGEQIARMYNMRMLHDYAHRGVSRDRAPALYSLGWNNVTLMAEFADLETAVVTDPPDFDGMRELRLTLGDMRVLARNFDEFHLRDLEAVRLVVRSLARMVLIGDQQGQRMVAAMFDAAYWQTRGRG
jgi:hypothetical protein